MEYLPSFRDDLHADIQPSFMHSFKDEHDAKMMYGLPKVKKFPMPDAKHVQSAIRFFNYAKPSQEQQLASAILARMQEYGISADNLNVGDENRFKKYLINSTELKHHGIKGQKWGVRRFQNLDGSYTALGSANRKQLSKIDRKYDKLAKKDAKEYARAKMSYGEGAGNRRKLIKNKVEQRRKENEHYNKVFDEYLAQEDMSKHADAAKRERTAKDAAKTTKRVAKTAVKVFNTVAPLLHDDETDAYLAHHGIKGQKWGIRRYQNEDGTLTDAGKKRQQKQEYKAAKKYLKIADKQGKLTVSNIDDPNYKNRKSVQKKMIKELDQSKEVKDYLDYDQKLYNLVKEAADRQGIPMNQITLSSKDPAVAELIKRQEAATNKGRQIADKYINEFSKALLRDIHAEDTEGGRMYVKEFLNKNGYQEILI